MIKNFIYLLDTIVSFADLLFGVKGISTAWVLLCYLSYNSKIITKNRMQWKVCILGWQPSLVSLYAESSTVTIPLLTEGSLSSHIRGKHHNNSVFLRVSGDVDQICRCIVAGFFANAARLDAYGNYRYIVFIWTFHQPDFIQNKLSCF